MKKFLIFTFLVFSQSFTMKRNDGSDVSLNLNHRYSNVDISDDTNPKMESQGMQIFKKRIESNNKLHQKSCCCICCMVLAMITCNGYFAYSSSILKNN